MHRGYIKIWRKIDDSGLLQMHGTLALLVYMVMQATHKDMKIGTQNGVIELSRGQFISGRHKLSAAVGLSEQSTRTCLERLHDLDIITSKSTNHYTIYTIVNYGQYQDSSEHHNQQNNQQVTSDQPTGNQQLTTKQELLNTISIKESISNTNVLLVTSDAVDCPHVEIIKLYAELLPELPQPRIWEGQRKKNLSSRWKWVLSDLKKHDKPDSREDGIDFFRRMFIYISKSDFLMGRSEKWSAELGWIVKAENFAKIIQGNYENKDKP